MRIKQISITDKGKKLSISWYSGEEDNTLNTVSGTDKPLPSFKEAWDALAAAMWDFLSFPTPPDYAVGRYQRPKKTMRLQKMTFVKTDTDKGHFEKIRMVLALCPFAQTSDIMLINVPPVYIKNTYTDDNPEECCTAGEASPQLYKLIEAVKAEVERYINGERLQPQLPGMEEEAAPANMEAREVDMLAEAQAADQAADKENAEKPIKVVKKGRKKG